MSDGSTIEWTDATWQPITGCSIVSPGCTNCYAMKLAGTRLRHHPSRAGLTTPTRAGPVWNGVVRFNRDWLKQPLGWKRPRRIFVCAHGDLFHEAVPDQWIDDVFAVMALAHQHSFQVLTKRAKRMRNYFDGHAITNVARAMTEMGFGNTPAALKNHWPLSNVWLGVSAERQQEADERIPELLATPAAVRFISAEPLLGPLDLAARQWIPSFKSILREPPYLDWVIAGGESGADARPMSILWARELRDQCTASRVPFFFKQWGEWRPAGMHLSEDPGVFAFGDYEHDRNAMVRIDGYPRQFTKFGARAVLERVGKKHAGRKLDGVEHNGFPRAAGAAA